MNFAHQLIFEKLLILG